MGISQEILSDNPYNQSMDTLHNIIESLLQGVPASTVSKTHIPEYWPKILVFNNTISLPTSSKSLKNSIISLAIPILQDPLPIYLTSHLPQDLKKPILEVIQHQKTRIRREIQYF